MKLNLFSNSDIPARFKPLSDWLYTTAGVLAAVGVVTAAESIYPTGRPELTTVDSAIGFMIMAFTVLCAATALPKIRYMDYRSKHPMGEASIIKESDDSRKGFRIWFGRGK